MADLDPDSLKKLLVRDLKEHLSLRGLSTAGLKADLVKRLRDALLKEKQGTGFPSAEGDEQTDEEPVGEEVSKDSSTEEEIDEVSQMPVDQLQSESHLGTIDDANQSEIGEEVDVEKAEQEALQKAEEEARLRTEGETRLRAEEEERLRLEEQERVRVEEEARLRVEAETRLRAEQEARLRAEEEARLRAEEEARLRAEEEAKLRAEEAEEARLRAEEEARLQAEEEARLQAEEEARLRAEKAARLVADKEAEEARLRAVNEARLKADEEARQKAEHEAILRAEEAERQRTEEEAIKRAERETRRRAEEEAIQRAERETRRRAEEEAIQRAEQETRRRAEEEAKQRAEQEAIQRAEEEIQSMEVEFEMMRAEASRKKAAELAMLQAQEEDRRREEAQRQAEEQKIIKDRKKTEEAAAKELQQLSEKKKAEEFEKRRIQAQKDLDQSEIDAIQLPQAIEKVLALKNERAQELGTEEPVKKGSNKSVVPLIADEEEELYVVEEDDIPNKDKKSKTRRRKKKKKKSRSERAQMIILPEANDKEMDVDVEYVQDNIDISDPMYLQFIKILEKFKFSDGKDETPATKDAKKDEKAEPIILRKKPADIDEEEEEEKDEEKMEEEKKMSKRKLKKLRRMTVAELKQKVSRPELVEMHDVTAKDPVLLLHLKASRNTVPVPRHWCFKRKYLQGKRGIEKPAFDLPDFIKRTGIMEMRQALQEKEDQKTMKAKMRERVRPKMGKIDIDYQKLHDAFFKWQTKPKMTIHGDLYYEGKEFETRLKEKKPGDLSEDLRTALGMPTGPNANKCPPPWLIAMQRYGPPPSYPNLKIPGLNAPIPDDCSFGYHAGGWGKPPVDEAGRPLYGDVFGTQNPDNLANIPEEEIDNTLWGEMESESSEEEEDEEDEEDEDDEDKAEDESGLVTPAEGLITPSGFSSIPTGMETPDMIELRKRKVEELEGGDTPALYTILPEKRTDRVGAAMMASTHVYDLAGAMPGSKVKAPAAAAPSQGIELALDPSELEMDSAAMAARYEQTMREQQSQLEKEDLSDMVAEHAARQKNKRKKQQLTSNAKPPKKYKEFKF